MVLFYVFFGFLVLFFVAVIILGITTDIWRKLLRGRISKMSTHEIDSRLSIVSDKLENSWSIKKKLEYELLLAEFYKRKME